MGVLCWELRATRERAVAVPDEENKDTGLGWVVTAAAIGLVVLGAFYVGLRCPYGVHSLADHANLGNALAPVVAFLTLLAVVSALWSVQIQRTELALQRKELQSTREEMVEQRKQFERTAKAQEALAQSQQQLAEAQQAANAEAAALRYAQHSSNIAVLIQTLASLDVAQANGAVANSALFNTNLPALNKRREQLNARLNRELLAEKLVANALRLGFAGDPTLHTKVATGANEDDA